MKLNGCKLAMAAGDQLPPLTPAVAGKGPLHLAPASITFLAVPGAANEACR